MIQKNSNLSANDAWEAILQKYNIVEEIEKNGIFHIKASQIKEFKEPRLMAKWDSTKALPPALRDRKINILPDSRSSYVMGDFILYQEIPELIENVTQMDQVVLPELESIDVNNISSEANAINVLIISGILDDFLETEQNISTFNGRMGTGEFDFYVDTYAHDKCKVSVNNAQCEIDGGFENESSVVIMEAKNVVHPDFHIRQLYYPYRLWEKRVRKPIRLVFSVYSNMIYRLFEYRFTDLADFSSIELVKSKNYSLQDTSITIEDLIEIRKNTSIKTDDDMTKTKIPFIQADSMSRIISLLENLYENPMTVGQITEFMQFEERQSYYYIAAGDYLGLYKKHKEDKQTIVELTTLGEKVFKMNYKQRQLKLVSLMFEHRIFAELFDEMTETGEMSEKANIMAKMRKYNVCNESQIGRRAGSVSSWIKWIFSLTNI